MDREKIEHIIESAYQDMQGVMYGQKGYRLRHAELADAIEALITARVVKELEEVNRLNKIEGTGRLHIASYVQDRIATLQKGES